MQKENVEAWNGFVGISLQLAVLFFPNRAINYSGAIFTEFAEVSLLILIERAVQNVIFK